MRRADLILAAAAALACSPLAITAGVAVASREAPAVEARLIGFCNGRVFAGMSESAFPETGCEWIEPIRYLEDGSAQWRDDSHGGRKLHIN